MSKNLGCGVHTLQIILFVFNFIIWAAGFAIVIVGLWAYLSGEPLPYIDIVNGANDMWSAALILLLIVGACMFFLGFLGCYGAAHQNSCLLHIYFFFLMAALIVQLVVIILAIVFYDELEDKLLDAMKEQIRDEYQYEQSGIGIDGAWNKLMVENSCCGADNFFDFEYGVFYNNSNGFLSVPYTCCIGARADGDNFAPPPFANRRDCMDEAERFTDPVEDPFVYLNPLGCYQKLVDWMEARSIFVICVGFGFLGIQAVLAVMTCCILQALKGD